MEYNEYRILEHLYNHQHQSDEVDIRNLLIELYGHADRTQPYNLQTIGKKISKLLRVMSEDDNYIDISQYNSIGTKRGEEIIWITDLPALTAKIKDGGIEAFEKHKNKGIQERINDSILQVNESTVQLNTVTHSNINFQQTSQIWTIILAGLSTIFISITTYKSCSDNQEGAVRALTDTMRTQYKLIQKLDSSLIEINSSIRKKSVDTVYVKTITPTNKKE